MSQHHRLYNAARWRKRRAWQLRSEPLCRLCLEILGRPVIATVADHITPHRGDPKLFEGKLQSLCVHCHNSWKAQQERHGYFTGFDRNGRPLDPAHPWRAND